MPPGARTFPDTVEAPGHSAAVLGLRVVVVFLFFLGVCDFLGGCLVSFVCVRVIFLRCFSFRCVPFFCWGVCVLFFLGAFARVFLRSLISVFYARAIVLHLFDFLRCLWYFLFDYYASYFFMLVFFALFSFFFLCARDIFLRLFVFP